MIERQGLGSKRESSRDPPARIQTLRLWRHKISQAPGAGTAVPASKRHGSNGAGMPRRPTASLQSRLFVSQTDFSVDKHKTRQHRVYPTASKLAHSACLARRSRPSPAHGIWRAHRCGGLGNVPGAPAWAAAPMKRSVRACPAAVPTPGQTFARPPAPSVTPFCQGNFHRKKWSGPVSNQAERLPTGPAASPRWPPRCGAYDDAPPQRLPSNPGAPSHKRRGRSTGRILTPPAPPCQVAGLTARKGTAAMVCVLAGMTLVGFPARVSC